MLAVFAVLFAMIWTNESRVSDRKVDVVAFEPSLTPSDTVLIKFGATWCGPCKEIEGEIDKLDLAKLQIKVVKVDIDEKRDLSSQYGIQAIPHLMLVRGGKSLDEHKGFMTHGQLENWILSHQ